MKNEKNTEDAVKAEITENETASVKKDSDVLNDDKDYKKGKRLYDIGLIIFSIMLILHLTMRFMGIELYIGGTICTRFIIFLYLIPNFMMIFGLFKSNKVQKRLGVKMKGDNVCFFISVALAVFIILGGTYEVVLPSYHVYDIENIEATDGRQFTVAKSETVTIFGERHDKTASYYNVDVYDVHGIFAKKLISCQTYDGKYDIEKMDDGRYRLNLSFLGRKEGYPFEG